MSDNEIIKALGCCGVVRSCEGCPLEYKLLGKPCVKEAICNALDLINRQKAEIESCKVGYIGMIGGMFAALREQMKSEVLRNGDVFVDTQNEYYKGKMDAYRQVISLLDLVKKKYTEADNETQTD